MPNGVEFEGRYAHVGTYPIGIDPQSFLDVRVLVRFNAIINFLKRFFAQNLEKPAVKERIAALEQRFRGVTIIVGVDRLDYIKGVPQKLHALELFLTQHPEWIGKVRKSCSLSLLSPSRLTLGCYRLFSASSRYPPDRM